MEQQLQAGLAITVIYGNRVLIILVGHKLMTLIYNTMSRLL
jgi:hypothetical protein